MATTVTRDSGQAPIGEVTPEEAGKIRASAGGREQAPSTRQQAVFTNWRKAADALGDPFEVERIPISKLRHMRRDPMLAFGLSFTKTPHVRAKWIIDAKDSNGPNPQVAAHLDHDLRRIYSSFVLQWMNSLDFGFQALAKRFEFRNPSGTYIETNESGEQEEKPIWQEGNIDPIAWKTFVALAPEGVEPLWTGKGEFNGIDYVPSSGQAVPGTGASSSGDKSFKIDLWHALWVTNERDQNFGSIFGYPRLGYSYRYWWSYWFRWAIADRAFERKADPSVLVRHPEGEFTDPNTGETLNYAEYALLMGERMRSGGVIALPSEVYEGANGAAGTTRQWEIEFTKDATNFEPFDKSFDYLDVQKLRALWIPEQAFLEGKGGTSSRNVAAELGESFVESQAVLAAQLVETINRWLIPQWIAVNYPEFMEAGGTATFIMQGFADEDVEFTKQIVQLVGQQESGVREILKLIDLEAVLKEAGTPIASFAEQKRREEQMAAEAAAAAPPTVAPLPGGTGVVPTATGFSYIGNPSETIILAESGNDFLDSLPDSPHYQDKAVRGLARQLWNVYSDLYRDEYATAIEALEAGDVEASGESTDDQVQLAAKDAIERAARLIANWSGSGKWRNALERSRDIFSNLAKRASRLELKRANLSAQVDEDEMNEWVREHLADVAEKIARTTRGEVQNFIAARLSEGVTDRQEIARMARDHFEDFPDWKTDRLVRTEVRDVYNAATLLAAQAAGVSTVQAIDAQFTDQTDADCVDRDGKLFNVTEAFQQDEHPNGTLAWKILPATNLSVERVEDVGIDGAIGRYDSESETIYLAESASEEDERAYLKLIGNALAA